MKRKLTREIKIGNAVIGNNNPILIQSMTNFPTEDTQKNLILVPCDWMKVIKAKIVSILMLVIFVGAAEWVLSVIVGLLIHCKGISLMEVIRSFASIEVVHICTAIGVMPIILLFMPKSRSYLWGAMIAMLMGVFVVFFTNSFLINIYPLTTSFAFIKHTRVNTLQLNKLISGLATIFYGLVSFCLLAISEKKGGSCY